MAVPSPYGHAVSTEEFRRKIAAKVRRRRWAYVALFQDPTGAVSAVWENNPEAMRRWEERQRRQVL